MKKIDVTYKLLTNKDEKLITRELEGLKRLNKESSPNVSTRMKHMITSVDGNSETKTIIESIPAFSAPSCFTSPKTGNQIDTLALTVDLTSFTVDSTTTKISQTTI